MKRIALKKARLIAEMTEKEVCSALRIRKDRLQAWESGKSVPSFKHAAALAKAYDVSINYLDFSREANTPPAARPLSLEEIEALPFASVIWMSCTNNDYGVIWHWKMPVVVGAAGEEGVLVGETVAGILYQGIDKEMFEDQSKTYWTQEPDDTQLPGITEAEYNDGPDPDYIICKQLAEAITGRKVSFHRICEQTGIDINDFMEAMNGNREFFQHEIVAIRGALGLTDEEVSNIFFPAALARI